MRNRPILIALAAVTLCVAGVLLVLLLGRRAPEYHGRTVSQSVEQRGYATLDEPLVPIGKWVGVERFGVERGPTNASLSITSTNFTVLIGTNREVWTYYVPSTNRFEIFACRNGITNVMFWGYGGTCDRVIFLGKRRWYVDPEQAATAPP